MRLLAVAVLAVVLALSSAQNAFATVTLAYDNGTVQSFNGNEYAGVRFSLPSGVFSARLRYVRWSSYDSSLPLWIHITGPDHVTELSGSPIALGSDPAGTGCPSGWLTCSGLDLTSNGIVVTGDFHVIIYRPAAVGGSLVRDDNGAPWSGRSFGGTSLATLTTPTYLNLFIRVDIDPIPIAPVGGVVEPVNKVVVFAPYLALFGVIGAVAIIVWKRSDN